MAGELLIGAPHPRLRSCVDHYWLSLDNRAGVYPLLPDACVDMVLEVGSREVAGWVYGTTTGRTDLVQASRDFYVRLFGCEVVFEADWFVLLQLGGAELGFLKPGLDSQAAIFRPAFQGQGVWVTVDVEDVQAEYQRIRELGVVIEAPLREEPWGDRHFVVLDPNGIPVDVVQR